MKKLLFILVIASSCAPVYVPNIRNTPMFTKGGEFQSSFQIGNGRDFQAAVSITKNIGLIGGYSYLDNREGGNNHRHHELLEGGIGYFNSQGRTKFEFFAGYGKGEGSSYQEFYFFGDHKVYATGKYERFFIQPAIGFTREIFQGSFVARFSHVNFTKFTDDNATFYVNKHGLVFFEPAFVGRINVDKNFFLTFQYGVAIPLSQDEYFDYRIFQLSGGLGFRLGAVSESAVK
jgi:hypothetical protein